MKVLCFALGDFNVVQQGGVGPYFFGYGEDKRIIAAGGMRVL